MGVVSTPHLSELVQEFDALLRNGWNTCRRSMFPERDTGTLRVTTALVDAAVSFLICSLAGSNYLDIKGFLVGLQSSPLSQVAPFVFGCFW